MKRGFWIAAIAIAFTGGIATARTKSASTDKPDLSGGWVLNADVSDLAPVSFEGGQARSGRTSAIKHVYDAASGNPQ